MCRRTNLNFGNNYLDDSAVIPGLRPNYWSLFCNITSTRTKAPRPLPTKNPRRLSIASSPDAVSREDWPLLQKGLTAQTYLNRNSLIGSTTAGNISTGVDSLLAALNQEAAGQYALAVVSYQNALKTSNTNIPAKLIGDKLAAIQKDHPKEYEQGMQLVLSPPAPSYYPGMIPGMPYRPGMPGYPGYPVTTQPRPFDPGATSSQVTPASTNQPPAAPTPPSTNAPPAK